MKKYSIEIKWAGIYSLMTLLWMVIEKEVGLNDEYINKQDYAKTLMFLPIIAVYIFALRDKRTNYYEGTMSYKQGLISGTIIAFLAAGISPLTQLITYKIISPEFFPNAIECVVKEGAKKLQEAEQYFSLKNYIIRGIGGTVVVGVVISSIVAIFARKK